MLANWAEAVIVNKIIIAAPANIFIIETIIANIFAQCSKHQEQHWHKFHNHHGTPHIIIIINFYLKLFNLKFKII